MPKREDDFWASQKEGLRYCSKHKRYYREEFGCQLCFTEQISEVFTADEKPSLEICPDCNCQSLFWNSHIQLYECLSEKCKHTFTEEQFRSKYIPKPKRATTKPSVIGKSPITSKCPSCRKNSLKWKSESNLYVCTNSRCKRRFTDEELISILESAKEIKHDSKLSTWIIITALSFIIVVFILISWLLLVR